VAVSVDEVSRLALEVTLLALDLSSTLALRSQRDQRVELSPASGDVRATIHLSAALIDAGALAAAPFNRVLRTARAQKEISNGGALRGGQAD